MSLKLPYPDDIYKIISAITNNERESLPENFSQSLRDLVD
jgi:hypothetical protein